MTDWPLRMVVNVAYAYLAESADADDRVSRPVYLAAHVDADVVESLSARTALDDWLDAPIGRSARDEDALLAFLKVPA